MSDEISDFIQRASLKTVADAVNRLQLKLPRTLDAGMKCPRCNDGKDRFAVNPNKGVWNCRHCGGGRNGLSLVGHVEGYDLHDRAELLAACSLLLGEAIPQGGERETDAQRAAREQRMADALAQAERDQAERESQQNAFREQAVRRARGIYLNATVAPCEGDGWLREYLFRRTGFHMPDAVFENIRFNPWLTYWSDRRDERGHQIEVHSGYGMVAPFVDLAGRITGCHQTWIDLDCAPKFRPQLGHDERGNTFPTKKMRGTKAGSLIPVLGDLDARRWIGGEGIETVAAFAGFDGFRDDTFYFATGDLGNMAGPADPDSAFYHPTLKVEDRAGRLRRVKVQGPVPRSGQATDAAYQLPPHVVELLHLADGDSEPVATAAAMARAINRLTRPGLSIETIWPPAGADFASLKTESIA